MIDLFKKLFKRNEQPFIADKESRLKEKFGLTDAEEKDFDRGVLDMLKVVGKLQGGKPICPAIVRSPIIVGSEDKKRYFDCYFIIDTPEVELVTCMELSEDEFRTIMEEKKREHEKIKAMTEKPGVNPKMN